MDNNSNLKLLQTGATTLGIAIPNDSSRILLELANELIRWNQRVNLTAISEVDDVVEKHILDSLALLRLPLSGTVLDIGCGAGFPGIPLKVVRRDLDVILVDSAQKKIGFVKHAIAKFKLSPGAVALHARAAGEPRIEGIPKAMWVVSRAFKEPLEWLALARHYLNAEGNIVVMLGQSALEVRDLARLGYELSGQWSYKLPISKAERTIAVARPKLDAE